MIKLMQTLEWKSYSIQVRRRRGQQRHRLIVKSNCQITLTTGLSASNRALLVFLARSEDWLKRTLTEASKQQQLYPPKTYSAGEQFLFLGRPRTLTFLPTGHRLPKAFVSENHLIIALPKANWSVVHSTHSPDRRTLARSLINEYFENQGRLIMGERVTALAGQLNLFATELSFRCQRSRWGSCSARGAISLNWRLIGAPPTTIDYVIIHELAHLRHPNHSRAFWQFVESHVPDYRWDENWLKTRHHELDFLLP